MTTKTVAVVKHAEEEAELRVERIGENQTTRELEAGETPAGVARARADSTTVEAAAVVMAAMRARTIMTSAQVQEGKAAV